MKQNRDLSLGMCVAETIDAIIQNRYLGEEIILDNYYRDIVEYIEHRTPTAYGTVTFESSLTLCHTLVPDRQIKDLIAMRISVIQSNNNYDLTFSRKTSDFIKQRERLIEILHGGSAGQILLIENESTGIVFVRKIAARTGVEGNGTPKLHAEINFLLEINQKEKYVELRNLYPRVLGYEFRDKFITFDQEYIGNGENVLTLVSRKIIAPHEHIEYMNKLLSTLIPHGYALESRLLAEAESVEQLEDYYLRRAEGRIRFLHNCESFALNFPSDKLKVLPDLIERNLVNINGQEYRHPLDIISEIRSRRELISTLRPLTEGFCAHGDCTLLNMVFNPITKSYVLIDNRGHIGNWDALYDFGKLKFTLSGFGQVMNDEFDLSEDALGNFSLTEVAGSRSGEVLRTLNASFLDNIYENSDFKKMVKDEPHWRERILLAEAMHYLSDMPHRLLLDGSAKNAVVVFLLGTMYLNRLYDSLQA